MTDEDLRASARAAASRWWSWDGNPDMLSGKERDQLAELLGTRALWRARYSDLRAAADLLAEQYENHPLTTR
jgi:hypothetical protein